MDLKTIARKMAFTVKKKYLNILSVFCLGVTQTKLSHLLKGLSRKETTSRLLTL